MRIPSIDQLLATQFRPVLASSAPTDSATALVLPHVALDGVELHRATYGPMLVFNADEVIGHSIRVQGGFQEAKIDEVVAFLAREHAFVPEVFVDVGANIGTHLLHALKTSGFKRAVGVEPDLKNFNLLLCNVLLNNVAAQTQLFNFALSSEVGSAELELSTTNYGDHRIRNRERAHPVSFGEEGRVSYAVPTETLAAVLKSCNVSPTGSLLWMDTQGHEGQILQTLNTSGDARGLSLVMEFWPYGLERSGGREGYFEFLARCQAVYDINAANWASNPVQIARLYETYDAMLAATTATHYPHTDLLCIV